MAEKDKGTNEAQNSSGEKGNAGEMDEEAAERFLASFEQGQKDILPPQQQESRRGYPDEVSKDW